MSRKSVFFLVMLLFLYALLHVSFITFGVDGSNGFRVWNVNTGLGYDTIQAAINANETLDGHYISLDPGVFYEHVTVNKSVSIYGVIYIGQPPIVTINGNGTGTVVRIEADNAALVTLEIANGTNGVVLENVDNCSVNWSNVVNNVEYGISLDNSTSCSIYYTHIRNSSYGGILLKNSNGSVISRNNITENLMGIANFSPCSNNMISENTITNSNLYGIYLTEGGENNTILGNNVADNSGGIYLSNLVNSTISENNITNNSGVGLSFQESSNLLLESNTIAGSIYNFGVSPSTLSHAIHSIDTSNTVDGKPIYYWVNRHNMTVPSDAGYVAIVNSTNITVEGLDLNNNMDGVMMAYSNHSKITDNNITSNQYGILLGSCFNNTASKNNVTDNFLGLVMSTSICCSISQNNIADNEHGASLSLSSNNTISENNITRNQMSGLTLFLNCSHNIVNGNHIENNSIGVLIQLCSNNSFYLNHLVNNTAQVHNFVSNETNIWDDGSEGNYWSDYQERYPNATELDGSGIWDTPYAIDENNQDNFPVIPEFPSLIILPLFITATLMVALVHTRKHLLH